MQSIGITLLGIGILVALVAFGTSLGQKLAAVPILIGGALIAASWLVRPGAAETEHEPPARESDSPIRAAVSRRKSV